MSNLTDILNFLNEIYIFRILIALILGFIIFVFLLRTSLHIILLFFTWYFHRYKTYIFKAIQEANHNSKKPASFDHPEDLKFEKNLQKEKQELFGVERLEDISKDLQVRQQEKIVGIAKPIGVWTSKILGSHMSYLINLARSNQSGEGFWSSMVKAQSSLYAGKGQDRGV